MEYRGVSHGCQVNLGREIDGSVPLNVSIKYTCG